MATFKPIKRSMSEIEAMPIVEGQFLIATDKRYFAVDINNLTRIQISIELANDLTTNEPGMALDAAQGFLLETKFTGLENEISHLQGLRYLDNRLQYWSPTEEAWIDIETEECDNIIVSEDMPTEQREKNFWYETGGAIEILPSFLYIKNVVISDEEPTLDPNQLWFDTN